MSTDLGYGTVADVLRTLVLILGSGTVAVTTVVGWSYALAYLRFHRRLPVAMRWRGLLPRHVLLVAVSYDGLLLWTMQAIIEHLHHDYVSWRVPLGGLLYAIGLWAMWDVLGYSRHRYVAIEPPPGIADLDDDTPTR